MLLRTSAGKFILKRTGRLSLKKKMFSIQFFCSNNGDLETSMLYTAKSIDVVGGETDPETTMIIGFDTTWHQQIENMDLEAPLEKISVSFDCPINPADTVKVDVSNTNFTFTNHSNLHGSLKSTPELFRSFIFCLRKWKQKVLTIRQVRLQYGIVVGSYVQIINDTCSTYYEVEDVETRDGFDVPIVTIQSIYPSYSQEELVTDLVPVQLSEEKKAELQLQWGARHGSSY